MINKIVQLDDRAGNGRKSIFECAVNGEDLPLGSMQRDIEGCGRLPNDRPFMALDESGKPSPILLRSIWKDGEAILAGTRIAVSSVRDGKAQLGTRSAPEFDRNLKNEICEIQDSDRVVIVFGNVDAASRFACSHEEELMKLGLYIQLKGNEVIIDFPEPKQFLRNGWRYYMENIKSGDLDIRYERIAAEEGINIKKEEDKPKNKELPIVENGKLLKSLVVKEGKLNIKLCTAEQENADYVIIDCSQGDFRIGPLKRMMVQDLDGENFMVMDITGNCRAVVIKRNNKLLDFDLVTDSLQAEFNVSIFYAKRSQTSEVPNHLPQRYMQPKGQSIRLNKELEVPTLEGQKVMRFQTTDLGLQVIKDMLEQAKIYGDQPRGVNLVFNNDTSEVIFVANDSDLRGIRNSRFLNEILSRVKINSVQIGLRENPGYMEDNERFWSITKGEINRLESKEMFVHKIEIRCRDNEWAEKLAVSLGENMKIPFDINGDTITTTGNTMIYLDNYGFIQLKNFLTEFKNHIASNGVLFRTIY